MRRWRDDALADGIKGATLLRTVRCLHACLNLAARHDRRITNRDAWRVGLRAADIADTFNARTVIVADSEVARIVDEAYALDSEFGLYCEVHAVTGARSSQIARLDVADLQDDRADPRVMMPASRKGRKRVRTPKPVPITADLAARLRKAAGNRPQTAPLLARAGGERWRADDHIKKFALAAKRAGIEGTIYALRHSSIVRSIKANVPLRIIADLHDTSVAMIERTYSAYISHHADEIARRGLLNFDLAPPTSDNIVALPPRRS